MTDTSAQTATAETKPAARPVVLDDDYVLVTYADLKPVFGIPYTLNHARRLWKADAFPIPLQVTPHRIAWRVSDIKAWIDARRLSKTVEPTTATDKDKPRQATAATQPPATRRASHSRPTPRQQRQHRNRN